MQPTYLPHFDGTVFAVPVPDPSKLPYIIFNTLCIWVSGPTFNVSWAGQKLHIDDKDYTIESVPSSKALMLSEAVTPKKNPTTYSISLTETPYYSGTLDNRWFAFSTGVTSDVLQISAFIAAKWADYHYITYYPDAPPAGASEWGDRQYKTAFLGSFSVTGCGAQVKVSPSDHPYIYDLGQYIPENSAFNTVR